MNDNIAPIFQVNGVKTTIESTKELVSEKKALDGCMMGNQIGNQIPLGLLQSF